ncbi:MAG: hypothetical protein GXO29_01545 [Thermotogae bacterium]|nr:hypothetical protein [Thermotogota bacterium]
MKVKDSIAKLQELTQEIAKKEASSVVELRRKNFDDPLLTMYFIKGRLLLAHSFITSEPWYSGILEPDELNRDDLFAHAYRKLGDRLFEHLERYSKDVMRKALQEAVANGWDFEIKMTPLKREAIEQMFGKGKEISLSEEVPERYSVLLSLSAMGVLRVLLDGTTEPSDPDLKVLEDAHTAIRSMGIMGHYILFFHNAVFLYGQVKGTAFIGEMNYSPNFSRVFPLIKRESVIVPEFLQTYPWPADTPQGRPFAVYFKYRGKGVLATFGANESGIYVKRLSLESPEEVVEMVEGVRKEAFDLLERITEEVKDMPKSLVRLKMRRLMAKYPDPRELERAVKKEFGI